MRQRAFQRRLGRVQPVCGALPGRFRRNVTGRIDRCDQSQLVVHVVENSEQGRAHHDAFGHADGVAVLHRQRLHLPNHVVAQVANQAAGHRRQMRRDLQLGFRDQRAQALQRRPGFGEESMGCGQSVPVDRRASILAAPDQVRLHADDRVTAPGRSAFHAFQQERIRLAVRQFQERRNRGFQIRHGLPPHQTAAPCFVGQAKSGKSGGNRHVHEYLSYRVFG